MVKNQKWLINGYLVGKATRSCLKKFEDFSTVQFIGRSGNFYHIMGNGRIVLVCSIVLKNDN